MPFLKWSTSNRKNCTLVRIVKPKLSKNMGGGPGHSPCETISEARVGLRTKRTGLLLSRSKSSSAKSKFCISFRNQGLRYTELKGVWGPWWGFYCRWWFWGNILSTGVDTLSFIRPKVSAAVFQAIFEHIMLPFADQYYGDVDFLF